MTVRVRPYDPATDAESLYGCKLAFERGLGETTGGDAKAAAYEGKLTDGYRERWLSWVDRCVAGDERCVTVAVDESGGSEGGGGESGGSEGGGGESAGDGGESGGSEGGGGESAGDGGDDGNAGEVVGYVFVLPERLAMIWDAAVINELYVAPDYRGTGVADDLVAAAVDLASDQSLPLDRIVLDVDPANERARAFYDRHGFESWGEMVARPVDLD